jgi:hypothetical protein
MGEHGAFDNKVFRCVKVYYSNSVIITSWLYARNYHKQA